MIRMLLVIFDKIDEIKALVVSLFGAFTGTFLNILRTKYHEKNTF